MFKFQDAVAIKSALRNNFWAHQRPIATWQGAAIKFRVRTDSESTALTLAHLTWELKLRPCNFDTSALLFAIGNFHVDFISVLIARPTVSLRGAIEEALHSGQSLELTNPVDLHEAHFLLSEIIRVHGICPIAVKQILTCWAVLRC